VQVDGVFVVGLVGEFDDATAIYRELGARKITSRGEFKAELDPNRVWFDIDGTSGVVHLECAALGTSEQVPIPWISGSLLGAAKAFGEVPAVLVFAEAAPSRITVHQLVDASGGPVFGGLLQTRTGT